jgi:hypothetical protein
MSSSPSSIRPPVLRPTKELFRRNAKIHSELRATEAVANSRVPFIVQRACVRASAPTLGMEKEEEKGLTSTPQGLSKFHMLHHDPPARENRYTHTLTHSTSTAAAALLCCMFFFYQKGEKPKKGLTLISIRENRAVHK